MALHCFPNPSSGTVIFARPGSTASALDVFDASGRRVATMNPSTTAGSVTWRWDGRDLQGHAVGAGMFFARTRTGGPSLRVSRVR
jgi:hypothetical protein